MSNDIFEISSRGNYDRTMHTLRSISTMSIRSLLDKYGKLGVEYLQNATPVDTGTTRDSWFYEIEGHPGSYKINFCNSNTNKGIVIAILLEYGHATRNGGWIEGLNFIEPTVAQLFEELADDLTAKIRRY